MSTTYARGIIYARGLVYCSFCTDESDRAEIERVVNRLNPDRTGESVAHRGRAIPHRGTEPSPVRKTTPLGSIGCCRAEKVSA